MKPSQLLRQMTSLAGDRATEDVSRVRWLALLPQPVQRCLKILRSSSLDEQASIADELADNGSGPFVMTAGHSFQRSSSPARSNASDTATITVTQRPVGRSRWLQPGIIGPTPVEQPTQQSKQISFVFSEPKPQPTSINRLLLPSQIRRQCKALHSSEQPPKEANIGKLEQLSSVLAAGDSTQSDTRRHKEFRLHVFDFATNMKFLIDSGSVISLVPKSAIHSKQHSKTFDFHLYAANGTIRNHISFTQS